MPEENDLESRGRLALNRRHALKLFAAAGAAGLAAPALAACSSPSASDSAPTQTLRVGLVTPATGPLLEVGFEMKNGYSLFLGTSGMLSGVNVVTDQIDEGATTQSGTAAVRAALTSRKYDVLVGVANPDVLAAVSPYVTAARIPLIGTNGSPADMRTSAFIWRTSFVAGEASLALAHHLLQAPSTGKSTTDVLRKPKTVVVYHDTSSNAMTEKKTFVDTMSGQSIAVHVVTGSNLTSVMNQISSLQPDLVYAAVYGPSAPAFLTRYAASGIGAVLCGPGELTEQSQQVPAAAGVFTAMNYAPDLSNKANETFTSAYVNTYNGTVPTTYAMATYDAGTVLESVLADLQGDLDAQSLNVLLGTKLSFDSPRGRWQFNQNGTPLQKWYLRQVRLDGRVLDNAALSNLDELT